MTHGVLDDVLLNVSGSCAYTAGNLVQALYNVSVRNLAELSGSESAVNAVDNVRAYTLNFAVDAWPGTNMSKKVHAGNPENAPFLGLGHLISNSPLDISIRDPKTGKTVKYPVGYVDIGHRVLQVAATAAGDRLCLELEQKIYDHLTHRRRNNRHRRSRRQGSNSGGSGGGIEEVPPAPPWP